MGQGCIDLIMGMKEMKMEEACIHRLFCCGWFRLGLFGWVNGWIVNSIVLC
jgi:hypothetical protein